MKAGGEVHTVHRLLEVRYQALHGDLHIQLAATKVRVDGKPGQDMQGDGWVLPNLKDFHFSQLQAQCISKSHTVYAASLAPRNMALCCCILQPLRRSGQRPGSSAYDRLQVWVTADSSAALKMTGLWLPLGWGAQTGPAATQWLVLLPRPSWTQCFFSP